MGFIGQQIRGIAPLSKVSAVGRLQQETKPGFIGRTLDILSRPLYGVAGAAKALITPGENPLEEAYKGIAGQERETFSDVLKQAGWKPTSTLGKVARGATGFVADVFLDPLSYTGIGALTKTGRGIKAVKGAAGLAPTIGKQAAAGERALLSFAGRPIIKGAPVLGALGRAGTFLREEAGPISEGIQTVGKALSTKFRPKEIDSQTWDKLLRARQVATNLEKVGKDEAFEFAVNTRKEIDKLIQKGAKKEEIEGLLHSLETKTLNIPKDLEPLYKKLSSYADQISTRRESIGKNLLDDEDYNYWIHSLSKEEREKLAKSSIDLNSRAFTTKSGSDVSRKYSKIREGIVHLDSGIVYQNGKQVKKLTEGELDFLKKSPEEIEILKQEKIKEIDSIAGKKLQPIQKRINEEQQNIQRLEKQFQEKGFSLSEKVGVLREQGNRLAATRLISRERKTLDYIQQNIQRAKNKIQQMVKYGGEIKDDLLLREKKTELDFLSQPIKQASIQEINQALGKQKFSTNIPTTAYEMGRRLSRQEAGTQFLNMVRDTGEKIGKAPAGYIPSSAPELKGLAFQPEVAEFIDKTFKAYTSDEPTKAFLKIYDTIQNSWKGLVTFINPAFHTRNAVSNLWQNYLADVSNPAIYAKAANIQQKIARKALLIGDEKNLWNAFQKQGLTGKGQFGVDIERQIEKEITKTRNPLKLFVRGMKGVGSTIEDNAKFAHFIDRINKGYSPEQAAESVRKFLFDYSDLTDFERNVLKRVFPFYTWTRKNLPLQLETLITKPGKIATLGKAITETEKTIGTELTEEEKKYLPDYIKKQLPVTLGRTKEGKPRVLSLQGFIPSADINKIVSPLKSAMDLLTPVIKTPVEFAANYDFFKGKKIRQFPEQTKEFAFLFAGRKEVPANIEHLLGLLRPLRDVGALTEKTIKGKEIPLKERLSRFFVGAKLQDVDTELGKRIAEYERREKLGEIRKAMERAEDRKDFKAREKLKKEEQELKRQKYKIPKKK